MNKVYEIIDTLPVNDLNLYLEMGHKAGKSGDTERSLIWYKRGLVRAKELKNESKVSEFSHLIFTLL